MKRTLILVILTVVFTTILPAQNAKQNNQQAFKQSASQTSQNSQQASKQPTSQTSQNAQKAQTQKPTKKTDWAQFYVFEKDNARIAEEIMNAKKENMQKGEKESCPKCEWKSRKIKAVLMGDSITELWWDLDSDFFRKNNFIGRGISGQTTSEMLVRFRRDVLDLNPQYVFIMAGTNDVAQNNGIITLDNILGNLKSMVELAKAHNIRPILCSVPPAAGFVWRKDLTPAQDIITLNKMIREYSESINIPYIDYHSILSDENGGIPKKYAKDGVHPTIDGYEVMERLLLERFQEIEEKNASE